VLGLEACAIKPSSLSQFLLNILKFLPVVLLFSYHLRGPNLKDSLVGAGFMNNFLCALMTCSPALEHLWTLPILWRLLGLEFTQLEILILYRSWWDNGVLSMLLQSSLPLTGENLKDSESRIQVLQF
jgi:hypothetical protein